MAVPTRVLENGQWVTRLLDPYQILARNRTQLEQKTGPASEPLKPPCRAVLTQTLVHSPIFKSIYPARIRHPDKNDVLFITNDAVHIREAHADYNLNTVAIKSDFDAPIRRSKIFGLPREPTKPDLSNIIKEEDRPYWLKDTSESVVVQSDDQHDILDSDADKSIKLEGEEGAGETIGVSSPGHGNNVTSELLGPPCSSPTHPDRPFLPPQMLISVLENSKLSFLGVISGSCDCSQVVSSERPLPTSPSQLHQLGEHLAVDPRSRAFAVAAQEKNLRIYTLKPRHKLQSELLRNSEILPTEQERGMVVDGTILRMEFLHPSETDEEQIILLMVVARGGQSKLIWYNWNASADLTTAKIESGTHSLPREEYLPSLIIPLLRSNAFIVVRDDALCVYEHILTGTPTRTIQMRERSDPARTAASRNSMQLVQWARPMRSRAHNRFKNKDNLYLCREDGVVTFIEIEYGARNFIMREHVTGELGVMANSSLAVLDVGPCADDLLIIGGDSGYGGMWRCPPRKSPELLMVVANWTPLTDCTLSPPQATNAGHGSNGDIGAISENHPQRLFASTGKSNHGSIYELKYGYRAFSVLDPIVLEGEIALPILNTWILRGSIAEVIYVLIAHPASSSSLRIAEDDQGDTDEPVGFEFESRTLAALSLSNGVFFQITHSAIISLSGSSETSLSTIWRHEFTGSYSNVLLACLASQDSSCRFVIAMESGGRYFLQHGSLNNGYEPIGEPLGLPENLGEPTCLTMLDTPSRMMVFCGTSQGTVEVLEADESTLGNGLRQVAGWHNEEDSTFDICDSIAIIDESLEREVLIVCGLRNGCIRTLRLDLGSRNLSVAEHISVGHTSVNIQNWPHGQGTMVVHCGGQIYILSYETRFGAGLLGILTRVVMESNEYYEDECSKVAILSLGHMPGNGELQASSRSVILAVQRGSLRFLDVDTTEPCVTTANWNLSASPIGYISTTPTRILHSKRVNMVLALCTEATIPSARFNISRKKRKLGSRVHFLDLDHEPFRPVLPVPDASIPLPVLDASILDRAIPATSALQSFLPYAKPGEQVLGMVEWLPKREGKEYHMLIIHTLIKDREKKDSGRLLVYNVKIHGGTVPELSLKKAVDFPQPVYSVAPHTDGSSIIFCTGITLMVYTLVPSPSGLKFAASYSATMRSMGRHITIEGPYIYVTTANESLQIYRLKYDQLTYWSGDTIARHGVHHAKAPDDDLVLVSDMAGGLTGLWQPPSRQANNAMSTIFEAVFPRTISRILPVARPRSTQDLLYPGGIMTSLPSPEKGEESASLPANAFTDYRPKAFIGASTDGTITQIQVIKKGWKLLKFIENMCERHPQVCPSKASRPPKRHLEPSQDNPRLMHINGDVLNRMIAKGGESLLEQMLRRPTPSSQSDDRWVSFETREDRCVYFVELVADTFGDHFARVEDMDLILREVIRWMRYLMRPAL